MADNDKARPLDAPAEKKDPDEGFSADLIGPVPDDLGPVQKVVTIAIDDSLTHAGAFMGVLDHLTNLTPVFVDHLTREQFITMLRCQANILESEGPA